MMTTLRTVRGVTTRAVLVASAVVALVANHADAAARPGGRHAPRAGMVIVPDGDYHPLYSTDGRPIHVASFALDESLVNRAEFLRFVRANPAWRRGAIRSEWADAGYLADWPGALVAARDARALREPVVGVSWFAAKAYCAAEGKRLPTTDEWEYVAAASETRRDASGDPAFLRRLVALYSLRPHAAGITNVYGVRAMHGPVWEWTLDFNGAAHMDAMHEHHVSCASAAVGARDLSNYPAFLRAAMRTGLTGRTTFGGLGFRCAASA